MNSRTRAILVIGSLAVIGCATASSTGSVAGKPSGGYGEGLSCERRVKVAAIPEEYSWVQDHYPGSKVTMQALTKCGDTPVDKLHVTTADGKDVVVYFDISSFF